MSVRGISGGVKMGHGPGASAEGDFPADIELRYALRRGDSAVYTYCVFEHSPEYGAATMAEARFAVKLADFFDWMSVDEKRNRSYPKIISSVRCRFPTGQHAGELCRVCGRRLNRDHPFPLKRRCRAAMQPAESHAPILPAPRRSVPAKTCRHLGEPTGRTVNHKPCPTKPCNSTRQLPVLRCDFHRLCTYERSAEADTGLIRWCGECPDRA